MKAEEFYNSIATLGVEFFAGVPDSQLQGFCNLLLEKFGISEQHIVCANEGAAVGLCAGYYLATGKIPLIYMQNSGIGNAVNPITSLTHQKVYAIPMVFVIGWRGEPKVKDEPQHVFQGEITLGLLRCLEIEYIVIDKTTSVEELLSGLEELRNKLRFNKQVAIVVKKASIEELPRPKLDIENRRLSREQAIEIITRLAPIESVFISTTGKASRELFEIREKYIETHEKDFLTVGCMGHSSMIALGIAMQKKEKLVYCIDGDGALLMHMGSLGVIGACKPHNYVHIVLNNGVHETVGGIPNVVNSMNLGEIARAVGYRNTFSVSDEGKLKECLSMSTTIKGPTFIEVKVNLDVRKDLGRPTTSPIQNKELLMKYLR